MKTITINQNDAGQRLDKFLQKTYPALPTSAMYKYIRKKRIKVNHKRADIFTRLQEGDQLDLYICDDFLTIPDQENEYKTLIPNLSVIYEDRHIIVVDKPFGLVVHDDAKEQVHTLIHQIKAYLYQKGEYLPQQEHSFAPALCNRLDRNTGGLVIAAKTAEGLRVINQKIKDKEIQKKYLCIVHGTPHPPKAVLQGYLYKDCEKNKVTVSTSPRKGAKEAVTKYRVLDSKQGLSLVEVTLVTGRTHQIRAHMASIGHPLLGDRKYGTKQEKHVGANRQALYSYQLTFSFTTPAGELENLNGTTITLPHAQSILGWDSL